MTQISTSVQQTTEVVVLVAAALTLRAALRVLVNQDTPMMEPPAKASQLNVYAMCSVSQKSSPLKLFAIFSLSVNLCK